LSYFFVCLKGWWIMTKNTNTVSQQSSTGKFADSKNNGNISKNVAKESDRLAKKKAMTLAAFNSAYDNHHKNS
jgi:hypothetical protein